MATKGARKASQEIGLRLPPRSAAVVIVALAWLGSCSLQDLDHLGPGNKNAAGTDGEGGASDNGGSTGSTQGGSGFGQAGVSAGLSGANAGGIANGGSTSTAGAGGTPQTTAGAGGVPQTTAGAGGIPQTTAGAGGTPQTTAGAGGTAGSRNLNSTCPAYTGTGGMLLTPPSTSFEVSITGWSLVNQNTSALSKGQGNGNACDGSYYLAVDGSVRGNDWNGPVIDLTSTIVQGHTYSITIAARFEPTTAPATASGLTFTCYRKCTDTGADDYNPGTTLAATYEWVRLGGVLQASLPGCSAISTMKVYVQTDAAHKSNSLHVDDFRIYDMTPSGAGGIGAGGGAGASGNAGAGGAAGSGAGGGGSSNAGSAGALGVGKAGTAGRAG